MGISLASTSSTPKMASLVQQGWKAKRSKEGSKEPQVISPEKKLQTTVPKAKKKPSYSRLLSKRLHRIVKMTVKIPRRMPFPPLVSNPPPLPPRRLASGRYARTLALPPARPHLYERPQSRAQASNVPCVGH